MKRIVVIKGGGDLATGVAHRLYNSGFGVVITEQQHPTVVRRTVAFAQAVFEEEAVVEGVTARRVNEEEILQGLAQGWIPVLVDPQAACIGRLQPVAVVDAIIAKRNIATTITEAPVVIGLGPGFTAGGDVHAVIETMRGHDLGRVIYSGTALANTGIPGEVGGYTIERLLRAPQQGVFVSCRTIGSSVTVGEIVGYVDGVAVQAKIAGVIRGLIQDGLLVSAGMKIGDVDPRCRPEHCFTISDKARAIAGGVLEALLHVSRSGG